MRNIALIDITHYYRNKKVFSGLSLQIPSGKLTCLLGASGSGKTTVLKLIAGLEVAHSGKVVLGGETLTEGKDLRVPPHQRGVGYIFQDLALWPHMKVWENIAFGLQVKKVTDYRQKVMTMAEKLQIGHLLEKYPGELSGGQQQLAAIARSLVLEPKVLLLDEPLANLDVKLKKKVIAQVLEAKSAQGLTLLYVSHDHREAFSIADRILVLREGQLAAAGSPEELRKAPNDYLQDFIEL